MSDHVGFVGESSSPDSNNYLLLSLSEPRKAQRLPLESDISPGRAISGWNAEMHQDYQDAAVVSSVRDIKNVAQYLKTP